MTYEEQRCPCGEPFSGELDEEMAEVYDPKADGDAVVCHVSCIPEGYVLA